MTDEPKLIVDRVATKGDWFIEVDKHARKRRRTHYFNIGSDAPVCGEHSINFKNAVRAIHAAPNLLHVDATEVREDRDGNPVTYGVACSSCLNIVLRGIDLKANHARIELGQPVPTPPKDHVPPYTFPKPKKNLNPFNRKQS